MNRLTIHRQQFYLFSLILQFCDSDAVVVIDWSGCVHCRGMLLPHGRSHVFYPLMHSWHTTRCIDLEIVVPDGFSSFFHRAYSAVQYIFINTDVCCYWICYWQHRGGNASPMDRRWDQSQVGSFDTSKIGERVWHHHHHPTVPLTSQRSTNS